MRIVMATDGPRLGPLDLRERPVGGVETAFALLAEAFRRRGHALELRAGAEPAACRGGPCTSARTAANSRRRRASAAESGAASPTPSTQSRTRPTTADVASFSCVGSCAASPGARPAAPA